MRKHSYKEYRTNVTKLQAGRFTLSYQKKEREPIHLNSKQAQSKTPYIEDIRETDKSLQHPHKKF